MQQQHNEQHPDSHLAHLAFLRMSSGSACRAVLVHAAELLAVDQKVPQGQSAGEDLRYAGNALSLMSPNNPRAIAPAYYLGGLSAL